MISYLSYFLPWRWWSTPQPAGNVPDSPTRQKVAALSKSIVKIKDVCQSLGVSFEFHEIWNQDKGSFVKELTRLSDPDQQKLKNHFRAIWQQAAERGRLAASIRYTRPRTEAEHIASQSISLNPIAFLKIDPYMDGDELFRFIANPTISFGLVVEKLHPLVIDPNVERYLDAISKFKFDDFKRHFLMMMISTLKGLGPAKRKARPAEELRNIFVFQNFTVDTIRDLKDFKLSDIRDFCLRAEKSTIDACIKSLMEKFSSRDFCEVNIPFSILIPLVDKSALEFYQSIEDQIKALNDQKRRTMELSARANAARQAQKAPHETVSISEDPFLRKVQNLDQKLAPLSFFRDDFKGFLALCQEWGTGRVCFQQALKSNQRPPLLFPKLDLQVELLWILKSVVRFNADKGILFSKALSGNTKLNRIGPAISELNELAPWLGDILTNYPDMILMGQAQELFVKVIEKVDSMDLDFKIKSQAKKKLNSFMEIFCTQFVPFQISRQEPYPYFPSKFRLKDLSTRLPKEIEGAPEFLKHWNASIARHVDFAEQNAAVFKIGNGVSRELLAGQLAAVLGLEDCLVPKKEVVFKQSGLIINEDKVGDFVVMDPKGVASSFFEGTELVAKVIADIEHAEVQQMRMIQDRCLDKIDLTSYQELLFLCAALGDFDGHRGQYIVDNKRIRNLDCERHSAPGLAIAVTVIDGSGWRSKKIEETLPLFRSALLDMPQLTLPLTDSFKKRLLAYRLEGEGGLKERLNQYLLLIENNQVIQQKLNGYQNEIAKIELLSIEELKKEWVRIIGTENAPEQADDEFLRAFLTKKLKEKIEDLKLAVDLKRRLHPKAKELLLQRLERAQNHAALYSHGANMKSLMDAMYPETMLFFDALGKIGHVVIGDYLGMTEKQFTCQEVIRQAKATKKFAPEEIQRLEEATEALKKQIVSANDLPAS